MASNSEFEFMEYMDENSIDPNFICGVCQRPFIDPVSTPCDHTYCRTCITRWLTENINYSCPTCSQQPILINNLTPTSRLLRNMLDQIRVRCTLCEQTGLQRGSFPDHKNKTCQKAVVHCQAADIRCPWMGPRENLDGHTSECVFEPLRPVLATLITENRQLMVQVREHDDEIKNLKSQILELNNTTASDSDDESVISSVSENPTGDSSQKEEDTVFIRNLPSTIKINDIFDMFSKIGPIKYNKAVSKPDIFIFKQLTNKNGPCNAKVAYTNKELADAAVLTFNYKHIPEWNTRIRVSISDPKKKTTKDFRKNTGEENTGRPNDSKTTRGQAQASNVEEEFAKPNSSTESDAGPNQKQTRNRHSKNARQSNKPTN